MILHCTQFDFLFIYWKTSWILPVFSNCECCKHFCEGSGVNIINQFYWVDTIAVLYDCCCCSIVQLCLIFCDPWTAACSAPLSMGISRQEYGVGYHFILQGIFPDQVSNPCLLHLQVDSLPLNITWKMHCMVRLRFF